MSQLTVHSPRVEHIALADAHDSALKGCEPLFVPTEQVFTDDRGWSIMNQLQGVLDPGGQINFSCQYPKVVKAWHRHQFQTDFWLCLLGHIKAGVYRETDGRAWSIVLGEKRPGVLIIPPLLWHGAATLGDRSADLLYYVTRIFDPGNPDEQRRPFDSIDGFDWGAQHR